MRALFLFLILLLFPMLVLANPVITAPHLATGCTLTPTMADSDSTYPGKGKVEKSNKLIRPAGKAVYAQGERVFFMGRVLDERCMPVEGAHIELWQTNPHGKYQWATKGEMMAPSAAFAGSGTATTNNLGEFQFDTVFPGLYGRQAPHFHVKITHPDLVPLTTKIYFSNERRNVKDPQLNRLAPPLRGRLMALIDAQEITNTGQGLRAYIELTLRGKEKFSQY